MKITNQLDIEIKQLIIAHAPKPIAKVGDVVWTNWGWKKPHKVQISAINAEIVGANLSHGDVMRDYPGGKFPILRVELSYTAVRLDRRGVPKDKEGCGIILRNLTTLSGEKWERGNVYGFNHYGLSCELERP